MIEPISIKTEGRVILRDLNNQIYKVIKIHNLITTAGRQWVLKRLIGTSSAVFNSMEMGSSNVTPTLLDTGVTTLVVDLPITIVDDIANSKITIQAIIPQGQYSGTTFKEASLKLDDATCFNHSVFPNFIKNVTQVDVEWDIVYS